MLDAQETVPTDVPAILDQLATKIVHFLVDFHHNWFPDLALPPSDGRHGQLVGSEIQKVLDCLESIPEVQAPVQVFSAVKLMHEDFIGAQIIHSAPFKSRHSAPRMVCSSVNSNIYVHIRTIFVHIRTDIFVHNISVDIRTYSYIFVHIRTYFVTWIYLACDKQLVPAHTLTNHNGRTLCSSFRRPSIILVDAPNSRHLWISAGTDGWR